MRALLPLRVPYVCLALAAVAAVATGSVLGDHHSPFNPGFFSARMGKMFEMQQRHFQSPLEFQPQLQAQESQFGVRPQQAPEMRRPESSFRRPPASLSPPAPSASASASPAAAQERVSTPNWPSSDSHWAGIPTDKGNSKDWAKWEAAPAEDGEDDGERGSVADDAEAVVPEDVRDVAGPRLQGDLYLDDGEEDGRGFNFPGAVDIDEDDKQFKRHLTPAHGYAPPSGNTFGSSFDDEELPRGFTLPSHITQQHSSFQKGFGKFQQRPDESEERIPPGFQGDDNEQVDEEFVDYEPQRQFHPPQRDSFRDFHSPSRNPPPAAPSFSRPSTVNEAFGGGFESFGRPQHPPPSDDQGFRDFGGNSFPAPPPSYQESTLREPPRSPGTFDAAFPSGANFGLKTEPGFGSGFSSQFGPSSDVAEEGDEGRDFAASFRNRAPPPPSSYSPPAPPPPQPSFSEEPGTDGYSGYGQTFPSAVQFDAIKNFSPAKVRPPSPDGDVQAVFRSPQPVPHSYHDDGEPPSARPRQSRPYAAPEKPSYTFEPEKSRSSRPPPRSPAKYGRKPDPAEVPFRPTPPAARSRPQKSHPQYPPRHQPAASEYDRVASLGNDILDEDFREFEESFEDRERGVDEDEGYAWKDNGGKKYEYVMKDYRKPIRNVYNKKPEHTEDGYGSSFGGIKAYKGGFKSEKFDPEEFAKLDAMVKSPYEEDERLLNEGDEDEEDEEDGRREEEEEEERGERGRYRAPHYDGGPDEYHERSGGERDPDDNAEGYYYPREARDDEDDERDGRGAQRERDDHEEGDGQREEDEEGEEEDDDEDDAYRRENREVELRRTRPRRQQREQEQRPFRQPYPMYRSSNEERRAKRLAEMYSGAAPPAAAAAGQRQKRQHKQQGPPARQRKQKQRHSFGFPDWGADF